MFAGFFYVFIGIFCPSGARAQAQVLVCPPPAGNLAAVPVIDFKKNQKFCLEQGTSENRSRFSVLSFEEDKIDFDSVGEAPASEEVQAFGWRGALLQSGLFLGVEHGFRLTQDKTRQELGGPFLRDYFQSVRNIRGWDDRGKTFTNYVGHPMQGAVSGFIQIQNDPRGAAQRFGRDRTYWKSRLKATAWATVYSMQFEIGPVSEAALGNVGLRPGTSGAVDFVVTPSLGMAWLIGEDAADRYLLGKIESKTSNRIVIAISRGTLNPSRSFANLLRFKWPWHRDGRPLPPKR